MKLLLTFFVTNLSVIFSETKFYFHNCIDKNGYVTDCEFLYEQNDVDTYKMTICLRPTDDFRYIQMFHIECERPYISIMYLEKDTFVRSKRNQLTIWRWPKVSKYIYMLNQMRPVSSIVKNITCTSGVRLKLSFFGGWVGSREFSLENDTMTNCVTETKDCSSECPTLIGSVSSLNTLFIVSVTFLVIGIGAIGGVSIVAIRLNRKAKKIVSMQARKMVNMQATLERPISEGSYENPNVKPRDEYELEGQYAGEAYDQLPLPHYQNIEEQARALNKSVIELYFGM